ncbi:phosphate ABC transporter substrate-binding protein [Rufibacter radiotolerans]|uniref:Phosphate-binding protein n=1 Tax=Rufibacter radiotolerans TaxID=1379910 RepID=A0A0H4VJD6_9BACT|nr:phosphate ABC transporter substrate-binding protein [Rufibacter radiotolerans]AKQ45930.1 phosphate ABC transporter substrate-binding protein [Rufibacter radiotolerans]
MKTTMIKAIKFQLSTFLAASLLLSACGKGDQANQETTHEGTGNASTASSITIKGSDTVLPLAQQEAEKYMAKHKDASITVVGGGTGVGLSALQEGTTDIAMASRGLKTEEKLKLKGAKKDVKEALIAYDALSVVVHPSNPVNQLTREQLEGIFTGKISNWKEVGGKDEKIVAYSRETSSGTYEFFKEHVMDKKNYANGILMMPATGSIVQSVSQTTGAIGYIGLAYETKEVKALKVSYDQGKTFVAPSTQSAKDKTYPISRPLFFFYETSVESKIKPFLDYVLSEEGQKIVQEIGYIPLSK